MHYIRVFCKFPQWSLSWTTTVVHDTCICTSIYIIICMCSTAHMQRRTRSHYTHEQIEPAMQVKFPYMRGNQVNSRATYCTFINVHHPWAITNIRTYTLGHEFVHHPTKAICTKISYYYSSILAVGEKHGLQLAKPDQVYWYNSHIHLTKKQLILYGESFSVL